MTMLSRRMLMVTGGAVAAVTIGTGALAWWPGTASAVQPWRDAGRGFGDPRLDALAFAILAPNPHNRQPWQFRLVGADRVDIKCDLARRLPVTDPFDRQICIGFGCMIELFVMAAAAKGFSCELSLWPEGEPQPRLDTRRVASVWLVANAAQPRDPLFGQALARRSTKEVYGERAVAPETLAQLVAPTIAAGVVTAGSIDAAQIAALRDLTWQAWMAEYQDAAMRRESVDLMRIGNPEVAANPDGIELGGLFMGLGKMSGFITRESLDTPGTAAFQQGIDMFKPILASAQGHVWLITPGNSRAEQIATGRRWVRMNLQAQALGVAIHPLSQALQETKAMAGPYAAVHRQLGAANGAVVQMLGRIGYAPFPEPTPRWPLKSRLVSA
jgi:hypothetical protein